MPQGHCHARLAVLERIHGTGDPRRQTHPAGSTRQLDPGAGEYLDNISDADIVGLNIPNGIPLVYELDADLKPARHYYLGDAQAAAAAAAAIAAQGKA